MATTTPPPPERPATPPPAEPVALPEPPLHHDERVVLTAERSHVASPIGWSSIFAATVIVLGVWLALHLFGVGVGLIAIDPNDLGSLRGVGIGVGIWSVIVPIIALFIGGLVAGRVAPTINTLNAVIHGAVVWALSILLTLLLVLNALGMLARGVASTGSALASGASSAIGMMGDLDANTLQQLGVDADSLIAPINDQLQEQGLPPVEPENVRAAAKEALQTAIRQGSLSQDQLAQIVARNTRLSPVEASQLAAKLAPKVTELAQEARAQVGQAVGKAGHAVGKAAEDVGAALVWTFVLMLLGLGAAVGGSILSVRRERREHVVLPRAHTRTTA